MKQNEFKLIATDLDWTLVYDRDQINQENVCYIKKYLTKGYPFVIVTGRPLFTVLPLLKKYHLDEYDSLYLVCYNGVLFYSCKEKKSYVIADKVSVDNIKRIHEYTYKNKINLLVYNDGKVFSNEIFDFKDKINSIDYLPIIVEKNYIKNLDTSVYKAIISSDYEILIKHYAIIKKMFPELDFFFSQSFYLEVMAKGINKGTAIDYLAKYFKINNAEIITVGDSENDVFMFKKVNKSFAMANSKDDIKLQASAVLSDVKEANFKYLIQKYFNIK